MRKEGNVFHNCEQEKRKGLDMIVAVIVNRQNAYMEKLWLRLMIFNTPRKLNIGLGPMWSLDRKNWKRALIRHTFGEDISNL